MDVGRVTGTEDRDGSAALGGATAGIDPSTAEGGAQAGSVGGVRGTGLNTLAFGQGLERGLQAEGAGCRVGLSRDSGEESSDCGEDGELHDNEIGEG